MVQRQGWASEAPPGTDGGGEAQAPAPPPRPSTAPRPPTGVAAVPASAAAAPISPPSFGHLLVTRDDDLLEDRPLVGTSGGGGGGGAGAGAGAGSGAAATAAVAAAGPAAPPAPRHRHEQQQQEDDETDSEGDDEEDEDEDEDETEDEDEDEDEEDEDEDEDDDDEEAAWVRWFCSLRGNEFFVEVDEDYLEDDFNLAGLAAQVPYYDYALDMLLDHPLPADLVLTEQQSEALENAAERLYGLAHARFVVTARGLQAVMEKFRQCEFGRCPRVLCEGQPVLPVGTSDVPGQSTVKVFCPRCEDVYYPRSDFQCAIDGAFFGTTLPHLLLLTYPQLRPAAAGGGGVVAAATADGASQQPQQQPAVYNPRVFGFKLHPSAYGAGAAARVPSVRARLATIAASVPSSAVVVAGAAGGQQPDGVVVGRG